MCVEFIKNLSTLLSHVKSIETGETNIEAANGEYKHGMMPLLLKLSYICILNSLMCCDHTVILVNYILYCLIIVENQYEYYFNQRKLYFETLLLFSIVWFIYTKYKALKLLWKKAHVIFCITIPVLERWCILVHVSSFCVSFFPSACLSMFLTVHMFSLYIFCHNFLKNYI